MTTDFRQAHAWLTGYSDAKAGLEPTPRDWAGTPYAADYQIGWENGAATRAAALSRGYAVPTP